MRWDICASHLGAARVGRENATLVELERALVGFNRDRDGADLEGGGHGVVVASNILVAFGGAFRDCRARGLAGATSSLAGGVGVRGLGAQTTVLGDPRESVVLGGKE